MGLIKAIIDSVSGSLADQWLEVIEADDMGGETLLTSGVMVSRGSRRSSNTKGTAGIITDGSVIHVGENQFMILVDGGKIVDYTAEAGYFKVDNKANPSALNGDLSIAIEETFSRFRYGGLPSGKQEVFFINTQEIKGIKFGTRNPVNYFDNFYNAELFLRAHGTYSIKIVDPIKFYQEVLPKNARQVEVSEINEQYLDEFLEGLQTAINQLSVEGIRISHVASKSKELSKEMRDALDEDWRERRGLEIQAVGLASLSYDEESQKLINMRNQGAMLGDAGVREGYLQGSIARGLEQAGSNPNGSAMSYMGMGMAMNTAANAMGGFSNNNMEQMDKKVTSSPEKAQGEWFCPECGSKNSSKFCSDCGTKKPENLSKACSSCGYKIEEGKNPKFCPECGNKLG